MASMDNWWSRLSPTAKRNVAVGSIGTVLLATIIALASVSPEIAKPTSKQATIQHILTDSDPRSLGIDGISSQLRDLLQKNEEQGRRLAAIEEQQKREQQSDELRFKQWTSAEREAYEAKLKAVSGEVESLKNKSTTTIPPTDDADTNNAATGNNTPSPNYAGRRYNSTRPNTAQEDLNSVFEQAAIPSPTTGNAGISGGRTGANAQTPVAMQIRVIKEEKASTPTTDAKAAGENGSANATARSDVFIPAGSVLTGVLLNGLDAPTGKKAKKEPMPVLFRIKKEAILPNRFHADVRECFLLAAGFGDLSAERAYFRGETFSCVRQDGGVIEVPMNAYATGEDGKNGVRGRVVSKQGALLAQSMMAGFLRGFSDAFGRNQIPVLMTGGLGSLAGSTPFQSAFSSQSMEGGALKGAGYAMERLSHFYMDMAEEIYPVIEVDATRQVNFIVQKGTALKLKTPS
ncbi:MULTISPECIES: TraB/VirB10 family protein [Methylomonas]|uniref:Conjugal transfer protein TrbI n=1 Tax=Methylomonas methanica TaxID=421 RepID=A0A177MPW1_METMH|nr:MULTISPECIES: TraB/VirB10 family protein [Methylomonas]OAI06950.1 conjugal transfer protein TrbI [Methylomonas methanica]PKM13718.1 MAG: conjugal transfer protein TrbI [Gammaproteobacteria bacterium HGW-Gammaproteobacteria-3]QBC26588.1 conjugal transfer protein TrbI [Methylomonas sp. LW13]